MIKTTRSRIEIRQEPDRASSIAGGLLVAVGSTDGLITLSILFAHWMASGAHPYAFQVPRLVIDVLFATAGWFFLRGRSRVVVDLDHRMVARYMGVGGSSVGGNQSWDLADFTAVVLVRREKRRLLKRLISRAEIVCLRRPDGVDLELHSSSHGGDAIALKVSRFTGLPYLGRRTNPGA